MLHEASAGETSYRHFDRSSSEDSNNGETNEREFFEPDEFPAQPQFYGHSKDNCYICDASLGSFKKDLTTFANSTKTALYEILGELTKFNYQALFIENADFQETSLELNFRLLN